MVAAGVHFRMRNLTPQVISVDLAPRVKTMWKYGIANSSAWRATSHAFAPCSARQAP
jgi:hypothetical protein